MNRIDLKNTNIRTDLIVESITDKSFVTDEIIDDIKISRVVIDDNNKDIIGKKEGNYVTIEFKDITNYEDRESVGKVLENELKNILKLNNIEDNDECLVIGLGNDKSTPDALGPITISNILVTRHLYELNLDVKSGMRKVSAVVPGVMGNTGIETSDIIYAIVNKIKPKFIIVIDSLCSSSVERINKTIQITDTGIHPGSGIGNSRKELSKESLSIPVIAIGVPTVVETSTIVNETINYLFMHINYMKNNYEKNKLIVKRFDDYLEKIKQGVISDEDKKYIGGMIGTLNEIEKKELFSEVLDSINYNMIVTPKEIDFVIEKLADVISSSINNTIHKDVSNY